MKRTSTIYQSNNTTSVIDTEGNVIEEQTTHSKVVKLPREPNFVKLYFDHLGDCFNVSKSLSPILIKMLEFATYADQDEEEGGMILYLNKPLKKRIANSLSLREHTIDNAVTEFVKKNYMRRIDRGEYQFNPALFGKGDWRDISEIRATYSYKAGTLEVQFE